MIFVGIDIAKLNHYATVLSSDGVVLTELFQFSNDGDGFKLLHSKLSDYTPESIIIGLESTAHYCDNLVRYLVANDYKVCVLNPIQTSSRRKDRTLKTKTDKVESRSCGILHLKEAVHMNPDTEKLRKKYIDNSPERMTSGNIRRMSEDVLLDMDYFLNETIFLTMRLVWKVFISSDTTSSILYALNRHLSNVCSINIRFLCSF